MRIAISLDEGPLHRLFAERLGRVHQLRVPVDAAELRRLAVAGAVDVAVAGVINSDDLFWSVALKDIAGAAPSLALIGVVEPRRPALDEAADLAREIPRIAFVSRADARLDYLVRHRRTCDHPPTFTQALLRAVHALPLAGAGRAFALAQALHPSLALDIPEQAEALGDSRRKIERWFQGPDICSARRLQSICAAAEAVFLRLAHRVPDRETAGVIGLLGADGVPNPIGVTREIRAVFSEHRDFSREGGVARLDQAVHAELRRARRALRPPARWEPTMRYWPAERTLAVPRDGRLLLVNPERGVEHPLDEFGADAWELMATGAAFADLVAGVAARRGETHAHARGLLQEWLADLLALGLVRRGTCGEGGESTAEGA